jgi:hypothetical protein
LQNESETIAHSDKYLAIGSDLTDYTKLKELLMSRFGSDVTYFIISEVSTTYMEVETADKLIASMATLDKGIVLKLHF